MCAWRHLDLFDRWADTVLHLLLSLSYHGLTDPHSPSALVEARCCLGIEPWHRCLDQDFDHSRSRNEGAYQVRKGTSLGLTDDLGGQLNPLMKS